ncbi:GFPT1 [Cordylochernes scorpioides]|uniref:glutamine--fructose-6-phosphate transaminase (isomerizing) n=1 Tax=Cordylochernes scorpioides TaxID=51811 RepID=A0ABY6LSQ8_9ARAC|nr:GFPT1 [Cordylochernes scorpioides]
MVTSFSTLTSANSAKRVRGWLFLIYQEIRLAKYLGTDTKVDLFEKVISNGSVLLFKTLSVYRGIFAYINYLEPRRRKAILKILIQGLKRLEYRGYDSAEQTGIDFEEELSNHVGIAHTRWATHGAPSAVNSHPHRSDPTNEFVVVHNGIITNYKDIKQFLTNKGFDFESETDTEVIAKLIKHLHQCKPELSFRELVEHAITQLVSSYIYTHLVSYHTSRLRSS